MVLFNKFQGTGNDFIMIDQRHHVYIGSQQTDVIAKLCDRRFGIGADGLILLEPSKTTDFKMVYFNADGRQSTMCGNGGRCIVAFAHQLGIFEEKTSFEAIDGVHHGAIMNANIISLGMSDVNLVEEVGPMIYITNTGSPHYVQFSHVLPEDIKSAGAKVRYSEKFRLEGINVNFVIQEADGLRVATYERGVEDETYSCGTGVVAAAIMDALRKKHFGLQSTKVFTKGGPLEVSFFYENQKFSDIRLIGPAEMVFEGSIDLK